MGKDYEDYKCTDCGKVGFKLWRDYGYCDELWCATCCQKKIKKAEQKHPSDPWDEPPGPLDMMRSGFSGVAAIPCDGDCDSYQSAGAYKTEGLMWWHALPTFADEPDEIRTVMHTLRKAREDLGSEHKQACNLIQKINSLRIRVGRPPMEFPKESKAGWGYRHELAEARATMLVALRELFEMQGRRLELYEEESNLEWYLERQVYMVKRPTKVVIWGTKTETFPMEDGKFLRISGGEEQDMELTPGMKFAVGRSGSAVVLLGEKFRECPSIMDFGQDGRQLAFELLREQRILPVRSF
jgi:hypothetical protein